MGSEIKADDKSKNRSTVDNSMKKDIFHKYYTFLEIEITDVPISAEHNIMVTNTIHTLLY